MVPLMPKTITQPAEATVIAKKTVDKMVVILLVANSEIHKAIAEGLKKIIKNVEIVSVTNVGKVRETMNNRWGEICGLITDMHISYGSMADDFLPKGSKAYDKRYTIKHFLNYLEITFDDHPEEEFFVGIRAPKQSDKVWQMNEILENTDHAIYYDYSPPMVIVADLVERLQNNGQPTYRFPPNISPTENS